MRLNISNAALFVLLLLAIFNTVWIVIVNGWNKLKRAFKKID